MDLIINGKTKKDVSYEEIERLITTGRYDYKTTYVVIDSVHGKSKMKLDSFARMYFDDIG